MVGADGSFPFPWLTAALAQSVALQRGHALLVHGAPGDGAWDFANALAQAWLCEGQGSSDTGAALAKPCGRCAACTLMRNHTHPDQVWLMPQELAVQRGVPVTLKEGRKPSKQILVDDVRIAIDRMTSTTGRGKGRSLVIFPGEAMNAVAASALLKTLEEPPPGTRIVISAAEPTRLLPTIRSRCQLVRLPRASPAQAQDWLAGQGVSAPEVLLAATAGRPLDALALHAAGATAQGWLALPQRLARGDASAFAGLGVPALLDALAKLCHDAMASTVGAPARFFPQASFPQGLQLARLSAWQQSLQKLQRHADHPWNEGLLADAMVREGQDALKPALTE